MTGSRRCAAAAWMAGVVALSVAAGCSSGTRYYDDDPVLRRDVEQRIALMEHLRGQDAKQNMVQLGAGMRLVSVPLLKEALRNDPSPRVRAGCAQALGYSQDSSAVDALARAAADDPEPGVRYTAAYNLLLFQDPRGLPVLVQALSAEDPSHRRDAFEALRAHTGRDFGYTPVAEPAVRDAAAARWREWVETLRTEEARLLLIPRGR